VIKPLALTVITGTAEAEPNDPTFELTVAKAKPIVPLEVRGEFEIVKSEPVIPTEVRGGVTVL